MKIKLVAWVLVLIVVLLTKDCFCQNPLVKQWDYRLGGTGNEKIEVGINISFLTSGIYFIKIIADGKTMVQKVVKMQVNIF